MNPPQPPDETHLVTSWIEEGFLIFRPPHGMETWSLREPAHPP